MEEDAVQKKVCKKCNRLKPIDDFARNKQCKDGHEGQCKPCKYKSRKTGSQIVPETPGTSYAAPGKPSSLTFGRGAVGRSIREIQKALPADLPVTFGQLRHRDHSSDPLEKTILPRACISIDMTDYPDLYQAVLDNAKNEFRAPDMQILFYVQKQLTRQEDI